MKPSEAHAIRNLLQVAMGYAEIGNSQGTVKACRAIDAICDYKEVRLELNEPGVPLSTAHLCVSCFTIGSHDNSCPLCKNKGPHMAIGRMLLNSTARLQKRARKEGAAAVAKT